MSNFILSAFADEIDPKLDKQIQVIQKHGIGYIELRSIEGKNVSEFTSLCIWAKKLQDRLFNLSPSSKKRFSLPNLQGKFCISFER